MSTRRVTVVRKAFAALLGAVVVSGATFAAAPPAQAERAQPPATQPASVRPATQPAGDYWPSERYAVRELRGWTVRVHPELLEHHPKLADRAIDFIDAQLHTALVRLPEPAVRHLQQVTVWVEAPPTDAEAKASPLKACAVYHPAAGWLKKHGMNPDKSGDIEIRNPVHFVEWRKWQPTMILHELAHAWHHQVLGYDFAPIKQAYQHARSSGKYQRVLHMSGDRRKHYGLNNQKEYFAELTESFYRYNDFYPFVRPELKKHDPKGYNAVKQAWHYEPGQQPPASSRPSASQREVGARQKKRR